ncbi:MAG TPA: hypothetical protein VLA75_03695, partial [Thermoanaerobaculia bacterium]|nr:hypothetical protein [Thermoanaerobaculia bacterium]
MTGGGPAAPGPEGWPDPAGPLPAVGGRRALLGTVAAFALALLLGWLFARAVPVLVDTDSYYHLAVARVVAEDGFPRELPWARFSLLRDGFPDKEPLFHLLLAPFAGEDRSTAGGRLALAILVAALAGATALSAVELAGGRALLFPAFLVIAALDLSDRLLRLRPELLALLWILLAARSVWRREDRRVGLWAALFAASYTAFQAFLGLAFAWCAVRWYHQRRFPWALGLYALLGTAVGLLLHPAFPGNLEMWAVVNVHLFGFVEELAAGGAELQPATLAAVAERNLGFWLALAVVLVARRGTGPVAPDRALARDVLLAGAIAFGLLYVQMWRFGLYFFPLAGLAALAVLGPRGLAAGLPPVGGRRLPVGVALGLCALVALPGAVGMGRFYLDRSAPGPSREAEWRAFGDAVPPGARVAAPWGQAQAYFFFAPQANYLNFLDPVLMAFPHPREAALERALFQGEEPDVALAVGAGLDSDHLAFSRFAAPSRLRARASGDPRLVEVYAGYNLLYRIEPPPADIFLVDWAVRPDGPAGAGVAPRPYPRGA